MWTYVTEELPALVAAEFPGRHGPPRHHRPFDGRPRRAYGRARNPGRFLSVVGLRADRRAVARCRGARRRSAGYLGPDRAAWRAHDAVALIEDGARIAEMLVDQSARPTRSSKRNCGPSCSSKHATRPASPLTLRMQEGYDHSYYFISTFMAEHLRLARGETEKGVV